jgi:hypothetical protein
MDHGWRFQGYHDPGPRYYKGLGTSTAKEAKVDPWMAEKKTEMGWCNKNRDGMVELLLT